MIGTLFCIYETPCGICTRTEKPCTGHKPKGGTGEMIISKKKLDEYIKEVKDMNRKEKNICNKFKLGAR